MESSDWVQCNACFAKPKAGVAFYLSNCWHLADRACYLKSPDCCPTCKQPCRFMEMTKSMKMEVQVFFDDPARLLKKALKSLAQILEVAEFQRMQMALALKAGQHRELVLQQENRQLQQDNRQLESNLKSATAELGYLKAKYGDGNSQGNGFDLGYSVGKSAPPIPGTPFFLRGGNGFGGGPKSPAYGVSSNGFFDNLNGSSGTKTSVNATQETSNPYRDAWQKSPIFNSRNAAGSGKSPLGRVGGQHSSKAPGSGGSRSYGSGGRISIPISQSSGGRSAHKNSPVHGLLNDFRAKSNQEQQRVQKKSTNYSPFFVESYPLR